MVSAGSDSDLEGFIFDVQNISENNSDLSSDKFEIDIYPTSLDEEDFGNESDENDIGNITATRLKITTSIRILNFIEKTKITTQSAS